MDGKSAELNKLTIAAYAIPAFAMAMPTLPAYVFLPSFYGETLGIGLAATGIVLLLARCIDVITDPIVGYLSDRIPFRIGRRKPWICLGALLAGFALVRLFQPPPEVDSLYLALWSIVLYVGWTLVQVPYTAWGAELSGDYHERARITAAREGLMLLGILSAAAVPPIVTEMGGEHAQALAAIAWMAVIVGAPAVAVALWRVPDRSTGDGSAVLSKRPRFRWKVAVHVFLGNAPFMRLLGAWVVNGFANGLPAALFPLYLKYVLQTSDEMQSVMILLYFVAACLSIPLWVKLCSYFGKHRVWCGAMIMAICAFALVPLLPWIVPDAMLMAFGIISVITGMALGADLALPPAMQADVVDLDRLRTGENRAGIFFAFWSMATKLALAGAVGFGFPVLAYVGFDPAAGKIAEGLWAVPLVYAALPVVLKIGAVALVWSYPLDARRQSIIRRRLARRKAAAKSMRADAPA